MIQFIETKNGLNILIGKLLSQSGAYKEPKTKKEALEEPKLKDSTVEAIEVLTKAIKQLNAYYDLSITYSKELTKIKGENFKLNSEVSKLKAKVNRLEVQNKELIKHVEI